MFIIFIISVIFLFGYLFLPIGYLNNEIIVLIPLFIDGLPNNEYLGMAKQLPLSLLISFPVLLLIYFKSSQQKLGLGIGFVINMVSILILFTIVWMTKVGLSDDFSFSYGYSWLIWFMGLDYFFSAEIKKPAAS